MIDFPANPTVGQKFTAVGISWTWDGTKWSGSAGSGATVSASDTPPANPALGTLWWDSVGGQLYIYYNDGNSSQWVIAVNYGFGLFLPIAGGTLTGPLTLSGNPVAPLQPATKQYVDALPPAAGTNRIINGDMRIDQRNNGGSITVGGYSLDRWVWNPSVTGKGAVQRTASINPGFPYQYAISSSTAYTLLASDYFGISQMIEADMVSDFAWGTANAQPATLSFWVYSSITGTYSGAIENGAASRSFVFNYTIPVAGAWTKIIIPILPDTGGAWTLSGNGAGVYLFLSCGMGSTRSSSTINAWQNGNFLSSPGAVNLMGTNGAAMGFTGVKLEVGSIATPFNRKSLSESFSDCQRYYQQGLLYSVSGANIPLGTLVSTSTMPMTAMRAAPTMTALSNSSSNYTLTNLSSSSQTIGSTIGMWTNGTATAAGIVSINIAFAASAEL